MSWQSHDSAFPPVSLCLQTLKDALATFKYHGFPLNAAFEGTVDLVRLAYPDASHPLPTARGVMAGEYLAPHEDMARLSAWLETARASPLSVIIPLALDLAPLIAPPGGTHLGGATSRATVSDLCLMVMAAALRLALQDPRGEAAPGFPRLMVGIAEHMHRMWVEHRHWTAPFPFLGPCGKASLRYFAVAHPSEEGRRIARDFLWAAERVQPVRR